VYFFNFIYSYLHLIIIKKKKKECEKDLPFRQSMFENDFKLYSCKLKNSDEINQSTHYDSKIILDKFQKVGFFFFINLKKRSTLLLINLMQVFFLFLIIKKKFIYFFFII
jgi:hypothetical protein